MTRLSVKDATESARDPQSGHSNSGILAHVKHGEGHCIGASGKPMLVKLVRRLRVPLWEGVRRR